jgi:pyruvate formate lyase activating enzyme
MTDEKIAMLWHKTDNKNVICDICNNHCIIKPNKVSRCFSRKNVDGELKLLNYGIISSLAADPIEKKPLYHFYPFSKVMSVGTFGCNFSCKHCQNWEISQVDLANSYRSVFKLSPEDLIKTAIEHDCKGIAWTYNEPTVWFEYTLDCAKLAKENGLYTVYVTNGFISLEALKMLQPYLDAFRVDLKSFDDKFYQEICGVKSAKHVFDIIRAAYEMGMHIECVTNIIPTKNDDEQNLENIAKWIANLDKSIPWHVTRFFPYHHLKDIPPTPFSTLDKAYEIGKKTGLEYVYKGNTGEFENTYCPNCSSILIDRKLGQISNLDKEDKCSYCGFKIYSRN